MTQQRRNLARQERKTLEEKKEILSAFVAFPAKLMAKTTSEGKYFCLKDLLQVPTTLGKRD